MNRKTLTAVVAVMFAMGLTAAAQQKPAQKKAGGTVTISGCIEQSTASAKKQEQFVLANAKPAKGGADTAATRYELDGRASELSKHVNHQVDITGTVDNTAATPKLKVRSVKMVSAKCS
jgi:hypothetical protein